MNNNKKIFIAGHNGMVGSAIHRNLSKNKELDILVCSRNQLDLTNQNEVNNFFKDERPDQVYLCHWH